MILEPDIASIRPRAAFRLIPLFPLGDFRGAVKVGHLHAVHDNYAPLTLQRDFHRGPLRWTGGRLPECLGHGVDYAGAVVIVPGILNLNFVAVMYRVPGVFRLLGNANEYAGIAARSLRSKDDTHRDRSKLFPRIPEKAHSTF